MRVINDRLLVYRSTSKYSSLGYTKGEVYFTFINFNIVSQSTYPVPVILEIYSENP